MSRRLFGRLLMTALTIVLALPLAGAQDKPAKTAPAKDATVITVGDMT